MKRFKSAGQAQRLLSARDGINNLLMLHHHQVPATRHRVARVNAFQAWPEATGVIASA
jgi:putative transposase